MRIAEEGNAILWNEPQGRKRVPLALGLKHVCPAFNPPDIKFFLCVLSAFVVQKMSILSALSTPY